MNELIPISTDGGKLTVSARALHDFLEVGTDFSHWFPRMCEYGFSEGTDFNPVKNDRVQTEGGRTVTRNLQGGRMNELQIFKNPAFGEVRTLQEGDTILFCGSDVAKALGYSNTRDAMSRHCKGVVKRDAPTESGDQEMSFIPESDVYRLVFRSKLPNAERFTDWVTVEILPTIRKHGMYATPDTLEKLISDPDTTIKLLQEIKSEREKRMALQAKSEADAPKVLFADAVSTSGSTILIGELAKLIKQNGVDIGQNRLFEFLRQHGYLISRSGSDYNMPTQRSMERGWFRVKERTITDPNGSISVKKTTLVTGKGQQYFVNLFLKQAETWDERSLVL
jgi:prophage antirepressor-like protein